ncbi:ribosome-binding factor A, partial [Tsukamurella pulmonis]
RVAAVAATAQPAGEADPYKHDDEDPDDEPGEDVR